MTAFLIVVLVLCAIGIINAVIGLSKSGGDPAVKAGVAFGLVLLVSMSCWAVHLLVTQ